jgi:glucose/arabinose dehydrogenase
LQSFEPIFHQDLNGDGLIGPPTTVIEANGSTRLTQVGNHFFLYDSSGSGPSLKQFGMDALAGQFGGWAPIGAERTATGYDVAWKSGADSYTVWSTDSSGNYITNLIGSVSGASFTLQSFEPIFHQDLNGNGFIGLPTTVIEASGSIRLTDVGNHFFLYDSSGSGPSLKYLGADFVAGQLGGWAPIGAERTGNGYEVAWKLNGADFYTIWSTDTNGNYITNIVGGLSGSSNEFETFEPFFQQDLNNDGQIGPPSVNRIVGNDGSNVLQGTAGPDLIYGYDPNGPQSQASTIAATRVATGLSQPLFAAAPLGDTGRLFIVEKTGLIKILDLASGQVLATPLLNVSGQIDAQGERGLLGLAFDPLFSSNGFFYVDLINPNGDTEVRRYHVSSNPNVADPTSGTPIITVPQPAGSFNHKAGWIGFGRDGDLYISTGDGVLFPSSAQDPNSLLGKILRIDVHSVDDFPADPTRNYHIPFDNPFAGATNGADEIFALGLRNPWRSSFDRGLGDFYIADVGQGAYEEVNVGQKGANYGWPVFEGPAVLLGGTPTGGSAVPPVYSYDHSVGQSITGGYVYRGDAEALQGQYFFADFVQGKVFTLRFDGSAWTATDRTAQVTTDFGAINNPSSFGEDARGNLYLVDVDGDIFKLTPTAAASADQGDVLRGLGGDDMLFGGSGNDTLDGGPGADVLKGGPGIDTADYSSSPAAINMNLQTGLGSGGDAQGDILSGIENMIGSAFNDTLTGDSGANTLAGGPGADTLVGRGGNDPIDGGLGTDTVVYTGRYSQYQVTQNSNGSFHIVDLRAGAPDGTDDVSNVELFQFADLTATSGNLLPAAIESDGSTRLAEGANRFFLYDSGGSGPSLKQGGVDAVAGQFDGWMPIGAEQVAGGGYDVAWKLAGADAYTVWATDSSGNYITNLVGTVSGASSALESFEPIFHQDLNRDGFFLL